MVKWQKITSRNCAGVGGAGPEEGVESCSMMVVQVKGLSWWAWTPGCFWAPAGGAVTSAPVTGFLRHCPAASPFFVFLKLSTLLTQICRPRPISAQTVIGMSQSYMPAWGPEWGGDPTKITWWWSQGFLSVPSTMSVPLPIGVELTHWHSFDWSVTGLQAQRGQIPFLSRPGVYQRPDKGHSRLDASDAIGLQRGWAILAAVHNSSQCQAGRGLFRKS